MLVDCLNEDFVCGRNPRPAYFYCARNSSEKGRSDHREIICALLRQLSCLDDSEPILPPVNEYYDKKIKPGFPSTLPSLEEGVNLIISLTAYRPVTTIVIDALDECDLESRPDLFAALEDIVQQAPGLVKLLVSSRDDQDIVCHLKNCSNFEINAIQNQADSARFIDWKVHEVARAELLLGMAPLDLQNKIRMTLLDGAQGMLVILGELLSKRSVDRVR